MNRRITQMMCGVAAIMLAVSALVACDSDVVSASNFGSTNSSAEQPKPTSSSSEIVLQSSSSSVSVQSSSSAVRSSSSNEWCMHITDVDCEACPPGEKCICHPCDWIDGKVDDCATGKKFYCKDGEWLSREEYCSDGIWTTSCGNTMYHEPICCKEKSSSSSSVSVRSSSSVARSSSSNEWCKHVTDVKCEACPPGEKCICHPCDKLKDYESRDCVTSEYLKCVDGEWQTTKQLCPNGRWTTSCNGVLAHDPVCCTEEMFGTCKHISDYDGMTAEGNCVGQNGTTAVDCMTDENYECRNNNWEKVSCLNIKSDECKPGMGGCGYRLCQPKGIREIADCETGVFYYCDGEKWEVVGNVYNKRCAQGELEYCEACYREGEFEGRYKCEGGKWRKYGMGDETCIHISNLKCERGMNGCGACDPIYNGTLAEDCETGFTYGCYNGYWSEVLVQQPMN